MTANSPASFPRVTPYLLYRDVPAAIEWLSRVFRLEERLRSGAPDGTVNHAEMRLGDAPIMMGDPGESYRNPDDLGAVTVQLYAYVDDVDAHFERAKAAGARIRRHLNDEAYGDRRYDAYDLEGHLWSFAQHVRDVEPTEWGAQTAG